LSLAHPYAAATSFDGGDLDCGNGLLLLIRRHIDPLEPGQLMEVRSTETSVDEELPAWCRLTGNEVFSVRRDGGVRSFLLCKGPFVAPSAPASGGTVRAAAPVPWPTTEPVFAAELPSPAPAPALPPLAVMGIGSWPRPRWLLETMHRFLEGKIDETEFHAAADDAVRLCVSAQLRAGVDVVTDGEQRRDNYASFVATRLDNCQLVPITDLLPYVSDPDEFARELRALDVPAERVRHPAVFGPLGRSRSLAVHELAFARSLGSLPVKVALPGPYLLTRTMWMECISDRAYASREALAKDIIRVLREEIAFLLASGAVLVQIDEPVLTEVVHGRRREGAGRTFMCGALDAPRPVDEELAFAESLLREVTRGAPAERLALHVCRGNWTRDTSAALTGDYGPLLELLRAAPVGNVLLEQCTPRAGDPALLRDLRRDQRIGVGAVDQKSDVVESVDEVEARLLRAVELFGKDRVIVTPDCGFATFADNPIASADIAEGKLRALAQAAARVRAR
jgi:5-methyltetrahydropteroyltriglutamate--homocysteine methyltransferase